MQTYDALMLVVLAAATIFGFVKGLAWQIASVASLVLSYVLALRFADRVAPMVSEHEPWNRYVAMLIIYAATSLAIWMAFRFVSGAIDRVKLKEFDRQMGALVGFAKGVLFCIAITFFAVTLLGESHKQRILASRSGKTIVKVLDQAEAVVPPSFHEVIGPYIDKVEERLDPNYQPAPAGDIQQLQQLWQQSQAGTELPAWPSDPQP
ncbi:CvpA family protein [Pirellulales bacterium]|nr:CvpA family protein [Pirellulales bacterium]